LSRSHAKTAKNNLKQFRC